MKRLTFILAECLTTMLGVHAQAVQKEITVGSAREFIDAIGSNRIVVIKDNTELNLTDILDNQELFRRMGCLWTDDYYTEREGSKELKVSCERFDGRQFELVNVHNLTIRGGKNCKLIVRPRYANVLSFYKCQNIRLERLTIGHTEEGYCEGGVIYAENSENISIANCDLYGCGTYGIEARHVNRVVMDRSVIRDCSYGIMELRGCKFVNFEKCDFVRNREYGLVCIDANCQWIRFDDCRWAQNNGPLFELGTSIKLDGCEIHHPHWQVNKHKLEGLVDEQSENKWLEDLQPLQPRKIGPKK